MIEYLEVKREVDSRLAGLQRMLETNTVEATVQFHASGRKYIELIPSYKPETIQVMAKIGDAETYYGFRYQTNWLSANVGDFLIERSDTESKVFLIVGVETGAEGLLSIPSIPLSTSALPATLIPILQVGDTVTVDYKLNYTFRWEPSFITLENIRDYGRIFATEANMWSCYSISYSDDGLTVETGDEDLLRNLFVDCVIDMLINSFVQRRVLQTGITDGTIRDPVLHINLNYEPIDWRWRLASYCFDPAAL